LSIDDTVWSAPTWVIEKITGAGIIVSYAWAVEVTETMPETMSIAISTECDYWLISNVT
jgi:hypothetical protein